MDTRTLNCQNEMKMNPLLTTSLLILSIVCVAATANASRRIISSGNVEMGTGLMSESILEGRRAWQIDQGISEEDRIIDDALWEYEHTRSARSLEILRQALAPDSTANWLPIVVSNLPYNHDTLAILKAFVMGEGDESFDQDARLSAITRLRFFPKNMYLNKEEYAELIAFFEQLEARGEKDPYEFGARGNRAYSALEYLKSWKAKRLRIKKKPKEPQPKPTPPLAAPTVEQTSQAATDPIAEVSERSIAELPEQTPSKTPPNRWLWLGLLFLFLLILVGALVRITRR